MAGKAALPGLPLKMSIVPVLYYVSLGNKKPAKPSGLRVSIYRFNNLVGRGQPNNAMYAVLLKDLCDS